MIHEMFQFDKDFSTMFPLNFFSYPKLKTEYFKYFFKLKKNYQFTLLQAEKQFCFKSVVQCKVFFYWLFIDQFNVNV